MLIHQEARGEENAGQVERAQAGEENQEQKEQQGQRMQGSKDREMTIPVATPNRAGIE